VNPENNLAKACHKDIAEAKTILIWPSSAFRRWRLDERYHFSPGSFHLAVDRFVRKVGMPRLAWTSLVGKFALEAAGGLKNLQDSIYDSSAWHNVMEILL